MKKLFVAIATLGAPAVAAAHPGHGIDGTGWDVLHFVTEAQHLVPFAAVALTVVTVAQLLRRKPISVAVRRARRG